MALQSRSKIGLIIVEATKIWWGEMHEIGVRSIQIYTAPLAQVTAI